METKTQQTENQTLDSLKEQVKNNILTHHPQLDATDEKALFQAVYDDYDEYDVLRELYDEMVEKQLSADADNKAKEVEYEGNLDKTIAVIEQMKTQETADAEAIDKAVAWLQRVAGEVARGTLLSDDILLVMKGSAYDADVAAADHDGEVRGRNYVISEHLRTKANAPADVPALRTSGTVSAQPSLSNERLGALAANVRPTIWERGNEKRMRV